ncbi:keratin, type I cytoskeletal 19-like [Heterodontus francisci]|uniref:keratin, type I cytoskeletal 19-like n=1 Tax=Heterodontus francisci TaxID=7792 RepID=UPI00355B88A1
MFSQRSMNRSRGGGSARFSSQSLGGGGGVGNLYRARSVSGMGTGRISSFGSSTSGLGMGLSSGLGMGLSSGLGMGLSSGSSALVTNEKVTLQNLNDRLANYLNKVRDLEASNTKMEVEIRQITEKSLPSIRDWSAFWVTINGLRDQINGLIFDNARLMLQVDNAKLAAEDFKTKFESELGIRMAVEVDIDGLRTMLDDMTLEKSRLEMQIEGCKEELIYIRKNHEEDLRGLRGQLTGNITVDVHTENSTDLVKVLEEIRQQHEALVMKNKSELEDWYKQQCTLVQTEVTVNTEALQGEKSQLSQLRHTSQGLDMELQSILSMISSLEGTLQDIDLQYNSQLSGYQMNIGRLEAELVDIRNKVESHVAEYAKLLNIKCLLEAEIATYRRLLEGEGYGSQVSKEIRKNIVVKEEISEPVVTTKTRVMTVVEETVNGQVVSSRVQEVSRP